MTAETPLAAYHRDQAEATRRRVREAMQIIEGEIAASPDTIYPFNKGRVSLSEICRRAKISESIPKQPHHHPLREEMRSFLQRLRCSGPIIKKDAAERQRETLTELREGFSVMAADVLVFRLKKEMLERDLLHLRRQLEAERRTNYDLRQRIEAVEGNGNVIPLKDCK